MATSGSSQPEGNPNARAPRYQMTPAELAAARLKETKRLPVAPPSLEQPAEVVSRTSKLERVSGMLAKVISWISWRREKSESRAAVPNFNKPPVQTELSLDNIKVVRNDLSDADVEVVSAKPASTLVVKTKPEAAERTEETAELIKA